MSYYNEDAFLKTLKDCWNGFPTIMREITDFKLNFSKADLKTPEFEFWNKIYQTIVAYDECSKAALSFLQAEKKLTMEVVSATQILFQRLSMKRKQQLATDRMPDLKPSEVRENILGTCKQFLSDSTRRKQFLDISVQMKAIVNPPPSNQGSLFHSSSTRSLASPSLNFDSKRGSMTQIGAPTQMHSHEAQQVISQYKNDLKEALNKLEAAQNEEKRQSNLAKRHFAELQRAQAILAEITQKNASESKGFSQIMQTFGLNPNHFLAKQTPAS